MLLLIPAVIAALIAPATTPAPKNGEELIRAMHERYAGKWYKNLTFVQTTTTEEGKLETWYEALSIPGQLRIDMAPLDSGNAIFFRNDSIYIARGGKVGPGRSLIHPLMVLGFDVYHNPAENTIGKLKTLHFDLTKLRTDTWQGRPVYVVGADAGDAKTNQFWIDQQNLLFVRMIQTNPAGRVQETQFNKYQKLGDAWISPEVLFFTDGKPGQKEEYKEMKIGMSFDPELFNTSKFARAGWIKK